MPFVKIPKKPDMFPFFREILEHGYHVFSMEHAKLPDYYPNSFPDYPGVDLQNLRVGEVITIRVFFRVGAGATLAPTAACSILRWNISRMKRCSGSS